MEKQRNSTAPGSPPSSPLFPGTLPSTPRGTFGDFGFFSSVAGGRDSYPRDYIHYALFPADGLLSCRVWFILPTMGKLSESGRGGWKTQGGGKHTVNSAKNPSPKAFLDPPPTIRFPPPFVGDSLSFPLKERGTDQTNPNFCAPPSAAAQN